MATRYIIPILGDQLSRTSPLFNHIDAEKDIIVMGEVAGEITRHRNHRQRVILFLSAMRHFRDELRSLGFHVEYQQMTDPDPEESLQSLLQRKIRQFQPAGILYMEPGRADIESTFEEVARAEGITSRVLEDTHFLISRSEFAAWAEERSSLVAESFYRMMRRRTGYLMDKDKPEGGSWNYDKQNRDSFSSNSPPAAPPPLRFEPDEVTESVRNDLRRGFPDLAGEDEDFGWAVTPEQAADALDDFVENRLPQFGRYQDAMWTENGWLYHSTLSAALNLRLIDPRTAIESAIDAYESGRAPLNSVEGFVRQLLGWREFLRGIYWTKGDELHTRNALHAHRSLPDLFWTGETEMRCMSAVVRQLLKTGYAHHIQRLMVAGLFCQLYGVEPGEVHDWFMALYIDSVEWVTLPNTVGMSQYADGGIVGTKPYIASGKYIDRMSNYCGSCRFDPNAAAGKDACPFTTLYWNFIDTHRSMLEQNRRTLLQVRNYDRKSASERALILQRASEVFDMMSGGTV